MKRKMKRKSNATLNGSTPKTGAVELNQLVQELIQNHKCHTVILYGSRARGDQTRHSDYDLMGVIKSGKKYRIAEKRKGVYLDIFIYPECDLKNVGEEHLYMLGGKILYEEGRFGSVFLKKLNKQAKKKYKPLSDNEISVRQVWLHKMYERVCYGDVEGLYRRAWLQEALLYEYFNIRRLRYWGSKNSLAWLIQNDLVTYKLFGRVLRNPHDLNLLKKLVERVSLLGM